MTVDLVYLALTALLTAVLWIPYIAGQLAANGMLSPANYRDPTPRPAPLWVQRANRAHVNAVESLAPFAALVLIAHVGGEASTMTAFWAAFFFWMRLAHAIVHIAGVPYVRTLAFALGFVATLGLFWEVMT